MFNTNFADDGIRTADLLHWKQPHCQLSPNKPNRLPFAFSSEELLAKSHGAVINFSLRRLEHKIETFWMQIFSFTDRLGSWGYFVCDQIGPKFIQIIFKNFLRITKWRFIDDPHIKILKLFQWHIRRCFKNFNLLNSSSSTANRNGWNEHKVTLWVILIGLVREHSLHKGYYHCMVRLQFDWFLL